MTYRSLEHNIRSVVLKEDTIEEDKAAPKSYPYHGVMTYSKGSSDNKEYHMHHYELNQDGPTNTSSAAWAQSQVYKHPVHKALKDAGYSSDQFFASQNKDNALKAATDHFNRKTDLAKSQKKTTVKEEVDISKPVYTKSGEKVKNLKKTDKGISGSYGSVNDKWDYNGKHPINKEFDLVNKTIEEKCDCDDLPADKKKKLADTIKKVIKTGKDKIILNPDLKKANPEEVTQ